MGLNITEQEKLKMSVDEIAVNALKQISQVVNNTTGGDWDEIEEARSIAIEALAFIRTYKTPEPVLASSKKDKSLRTDGKRRSVFVRTAEMASEGFDVGVCRNGFQTTIVTMDGEMLQWLGEAIAEQLSNG